jgi:hypothetical protein
MTKKKKYINKVKKHYPDEAYNLGPISIARFKNINVIQNNLSEKQHEELMKRFADSYDEIIEDINKLVKEIQSIVSSVDPVQLMHRGYSQMFTDHIGIQSEHEIGQEEIVSQRMVDYIQSVIAGTNQSEERAELNEELYEELKSKVSNLYTTLALPFTLADSAYRKANDANYDFEFDKIYTEALNLWVNVRGHRYAVHEITHLRDLLNAHDEEFKKLFGIEIEKFITGIDKIHISLTKGLGVALYKVQKAYEDFLSTLESKSSLTEEEYNKEIEKYSVKQAEDKSEISEEVRKVFSTDLFDVKLITDWPDILLDQLSWEPGQEKDFFADGKYCGWPLRIEPIKLRPFLKVDNKYYCFDAISLLDNIYRITEKMLRRLDKDYTNTWNSVQKEISENLPIQILTDILPGSEVYQNIYYKSNTGKSKKEWTETDGIIIFDDHIIVIEIKASAFTYTSPATDFPAYITSIKNLLQKPANQSTRFIDYMNSSETIKIYNDNHAVIDELSKNDYRQITACCISLDNFTTLASQAENLKGIGIDKNKYPIWAVSIDDLRVYRDLFTSPYVFLHFLEERNRAYNSEIINATDELDHIGLYFQFNRYVTQAEDMLSNNSMESIGWDGYRKDIDIYYSELFSGEENVVVPKQDYGPILGNIIEITSSKIKRGYTRAISILLDCDGLLRNELEKKILEVLNKQDNVKRPIPLNLPGTNRIIFFCRQQHFEYPDNVWMQEYFYKQLLISQLQEGLGIILDFNDHDLEDVDFFWINSNNIPDSFKEKFASESPEIFQRMKQNYLVQTGSKKVGRNDPCPCGSGKKYKWCHGSK